MRIGTIRREKKLSKDRGEGGLEGGGGGREKGGAFEVKEGILRDVSILWLAH
jgi:hypothetical protein